MATSSYIGKLENDGKTVNYIYCHNDGYIEGGVGEMLYKFYKTEEDVDKLLDLDDISFLGEVPEDDPELWRDPYHSNKCRTYKGRGEESPSETTDLEHYQYDSTPDYKYLFDNGEWLVYDKDDHTWVYLKNYFEKSEDESEEVEEMLHEEDIENIDKDYSKELQVGDKVVIKGLGENSPWEGLTGVIDWIDEDDFLDEFQTITVMVDFPVEGEYRKVLQNFDRKNVEKISFEEKIEVEESLKEEKEYLSDKIAKVLDEYGILYGDIVDYPEDKKCNIVGVPYTDWEEAQEAIESELGLRVMIPPEDHEEFDDEIEVFEESLNESKEKIKSYIIYGVDKDGKIKKEETISSKEKVKSIKEHGKKYLDKDESIIDVYFSKVVIDEESGEEKEIPLDSYTITRKGHEFDGVPESLEESELNKSLKEAWGKYQDYDPKDGWTEEDIAKHKEIDWEARNWEELDVGDEFKDKIYIYRYGNREPEVKEVTFHKFLRPNPIYSPYYRPIDFKPTDLVGPMGDGRKHKSYSIHDRYEDEKLYNLLSDSLEETHTEEPLQEKVEHIEMPHEVYTKPEDIRKINNELDKKAREGKLIGLRKEKDKLMLAEPAINGIWTIFLNDKGFITKITVW